MEPEPESYDRLIERVREQRLDYRELRLMQHPITDAIARRMHQRREEDEKSLLVFEQRLLVRVEQAAGVCVENMPFQNEAGDYEGASSSYRIGE